MRAVGVMDFGGPEAFEVVDLPDPDPGPGEVRIRVHAAGVNPTDTFTRNGGRADALRAAGPPPYVPGMDVAGVLDRVGDGADLDAALGDHVMAIVVPSGSRGGYSEYVVVPAASVVRVPQGATDAEAATLPMNGLTARLALDLLALVPGQTLAVTGAAGAFGGYTIQLAKSEGLRVIADAAPADEELVRSLGADTVVRRGPDVADRIRELVPGGVDGLADGAVLDALVGPAVRDGGAIATVRGYSDPQPQRGLRWLPVWVRTYAREQAKLETLKRQVENGQLTLRVAAVVPAAQAGAAHRRLEGGGVRGRLVLEF